VIFQPSWEPAALRRLDAHSFHRAKVHRKSFILSARTSRLRTDVAILTASAPTRRSRGRAAMKPRRAPELERWAAQARGKLLIVGSSLDVYGDTNGTLQKPS
jgi:hypothetical protein